MARCVRAETSACPAVPLSPDRDIMPYDLQPYDVPRRLEL